MCEVIFQNEAYSSPASEVSPWGRISSSKISRQRQNILLVGKYPAPGRICCTWENMWHMGILSCMGTISRVGEDIMQAEKYPTDIFLGHLPASWRIFRKRSDFTVTNTVTGNIVTGTPWPTKHHDGEHRDGNTVTDQEHHDGNESAFRLGSGIRLAKGHPRILGDQIDTVTGTPSITAEKM